MVWKQVSTPQPLNEGVPGVLARQSHLLDERRRPDRLLGTHSVSAGLDYPGVGPEHAWLKDTGRAQYTAINDDEALAAFRELTQVEGIMPALESSHAIAQGQVKTAAQMRPDQVVVVNLSGRGDKDIHTVAGIDGIQLHDGEM